MASDTNIVYAVGGAGANPFINVFKEEVDSDAFPANIQAQAVAVATKIFSMNFRKGDIIDFSLLDGIILSLSTQKPSSDLEPAVIPINRKAAEIFQRIKRYKRLISHTYDMSKYASRGWSGCPYLQ